MPVQLAAEPRTAVGKQNNKRMRASGRIPAVVYGDGFTESMSISLDVKDADQKIKANGKSAQYELTLGDKTYAARLKEVQLEPLRKGLVHVDFFVGKGGC
jgi:large subunit ribosomal protein L25